MNTLRLSLLACTASLTAGSLSAQTIQFADYWPVEAGYSWEWVDPTCVDSCSCVVNFYEDVLQASAQGPNAYAVGEDLNEALVFENNGTTFTLHGSYESGVFVPAPGGALVFGSVQDGDLIDLGGGLSNMIRDWNAITHPDKPLYGIDPTLDILCFVQYELGLDGSANPHNAVFESGLPGGTVTPAGSVTEVLWLLIDSGPHAEIDIEPDPMGASPFAPWPPVLENRAYPSLDCNGNGIIDRFDISSGSSTDVNGDCLPDECGVSGFPTSCPSSPNASGSSATLAASSFGSGLGSDLHLECTNGPAGEFGFYLVSQSATSMVSLFDGVLCLDIPLGRYNPQIATNQGLPQLNSLSQFNASGVLESIVGNATSTGGSGYDVPSELPMTPPGQLITPGTTYYFQSWFRDGASANFSNVIEVTF